MEFISNEYALAAYELNPKPMNELGEFVYYRTYSRFIPSLNRREFWYETVKRTVNYNMNLAYEHMLKIGFEPDIESMEKEAKEIFNRIYETKQFPSGRTLWVGGAENGVAEKYPTSNFNCSMIAIESFDDLIELFYMLMIGTGVGFSATKENISKLPKIKSTTNLIVSEYKPLEKSQRLEDTKLTVLDNGYAKIYVGDSKGGWSESLRIYIDLLHKDKYKDIHTIKINFNSIRPYGERLKTFGGTASGPEPLMEMFKKIDDVIKGKLDEFIDPPEIDEQGYSKLRPVHILDIGNLIGANVVIGGVRRTAEIFMFDADDYESMFAKYGINGIWNEEAHKEIIEKLRDVNEHEIADKLSTLKIKNPDARPLHHRRLSNNSILFNEKPSKELMDLIFTMIKYEGEPGFLNLEEMQRRRKNAKGVNPCGNQYFKAAKYISCRK